ncbi:MAG: ubiquinone/menaquinone biosynthesis methyltransferase [Myxococcota bacterium]|nr:ubiquinone/menaquinone biosynthesis methyltransferase [Myxococcota bacterium]
MSTSARLADGSGQMFDQIAARYDLLNRILSMGMDRGWRRDLVRAVAPGEGELLDVATGTADVALAVAKAYPEAHVTGIDPSTGMLEVGRVKTLANRLDERVTLLEGDAQAMPFEDDRFAASLIAFGIRNVPDRLLGLSEMVRCTRPGGTIAVLELGEPRNGVLAPFARFHVHHVVPRLGALLSGAKEYRYLQTSVAAFPPSDEFADLMREAGCTSVTVKPFLAGVAHLYIGKK